MIPTPQGWHGRRVADGVLFQPSDGPERAVIHYRERVRPLAPLHELAAAAYPDGAFLTAEAEPPEVLATMEGEHALLVTSRQPDRGRAAQRDLGLVLSEDFYSSIAALWLRPEDFAAGTAMVRDLLRADTQLLGERRRRFLYEAPAGWQARARGLEAEWYPLAYPDDRAVITVWPATPLARTSAALLRASLEGRDQAAGFVTEGEHGPEPARSRAGLTGSAWVRLGHFPGQPRGACHLVALEDDRHLYAFRLETAGPDRQAAHAAALRQIVESACPLPPAGVGRAGPSMGHWAE